MMIYFLSALSSIFFVPDIRYDLITAKVFNIKELPSASIISAVRVSNKKDTIRIISYDFDLYKEGKILNNISYCQYQKIEKGKEYDFILFKPHEVMIDPFTFQHMIIIDNDTVWKNSSFKNIPFYSLNSRGSKISSHKRDNKDQTETEIAYKFSPEISTEIRKGVSYFRSTNLYLQLQKKEKHFVLSIKRSENFSKTKRSIINNSSRYFLLENIKYPIWFE